MLYLGHLDGIHILRVDATLRLVENKREQYLGLVKKNVNKLEPIEVWKGEKGFEKVEVYVLKYKPKLLISWLIPTERSGSHMTFTNKY